MKIPPHSTEYEESIIAGCLLFADYLEIATDILKPGDFYGSNHSKIFSAMANLKAKKEPVDASTVAVALHKSGDLAEIGGAPYLGKLMEQPAPTSMKHYATRVKEMAMARELISKCNGIMNRCYDYTDEFSTIVDDAQKEILTVDCEIDKGFVTMDQLTDETIDRYQELNRGDRAPGIKTGYFSFDRLTGGLRGSKLIIIAARPRIGKTAFMLNLVRGISGRNGHRSGIFSIEMDRQELDDRWFAMETGENSIKLSQGSGPGRNEWPKIADAAGRKARWPVFIDDSGGIEIGELKRRIRRMRKMGVEIVFIDQLSKIRINEGKSDFEKRSSIVNQLADLKKELRMPIALLAQINRKIGERSNKMPTLEDLKSTGSLEEDADIVILGHRQWEYDKNLPNVNPDLKYQATWEIAKQRSGPTRIINFDWAPKTTVFTEADR